MNLNGIWRVEILTMYDWEPRATAYFKDGAYWGASSRHYAIGDYAVEDGKFVANLKLVNHGQSRILFGKKDNVIEVVMEGDAAEDKIIATAKDRSGAHLLQYRYTRLADLD